MSVLEVTPIIPLEEGPLELEGLHHVQVQGPEANVVEDLELNADEPQMVIELLGKESKIRVYVDCPRPYLVLHFKTLRRFMNVDILCYDDKGVERLLQLSNKTSFVTVENNFVTMPFQTAPDGWQYAMFDLEDLLANAFGVSYDRCHSILISGSIRVSKLFFQSKKYADIELPAFLRVIPPKTE